MTEMTRPGGFTPGINFMFDDGYCAPSDFCNAILEHIREIIPALYIGRDLHAANALRSGVLAGADGDRASGGGPHHGAARRGRLAALAGNRLPAQLSKEIHAELRRNRRSAASVPSGIGVAGPCRLRF